MNELDQPVTGQEVVDLMMFVLIEVFAAVEPHPAIASEKLEDVASQLLTMADRLTNPRVAALVRATAQQLIQSEPYAG